MIEKLEQSSGNVLGYKMIGKIKKKDYPPMVEEMEAMVEEHGQINLLMDMTDFKWEKVSAWGSDMKFGRDFRKSVHKMAFIGDKRWHKFTAWLVDPFFADEGKYFDVADSDAAWAWVNES